MTSNPNSTWIDLPTAAKRSGLQAGHLARLCASKFQAAGAAELRAPAGGGKPIWFVREDADDRFARVKFAPQMGTDLRAFPEAKRKEALRRREILSQWEEHLAAATKLGGFTRSAATNHFCERLHIERNEEASRATLYLWHASYKAEGLIGLVDRRGGSEEGKAPDLFLEEVKRLWLRQSRPKLKTCYDHARLVAEDQGWPLCSFKTIERGIKKLPPQLVIRERMGDKAFANTVLPAAARDYSTLRVNQFWCADHHQLDVIVTDGGKLCRPWLTAWEDLRSRRIVGWYLYTHSPNLTAVLNSFRSACLSAGIPEQVLLDNGKEFDSYVLQGQTKKQRKKVRFEYDETHARCVFGALGITVTHAIEFNAKAKPIERAFGTLCNRFSKFFPTYTGRTPEEKPENLPDQIERGNAPLMSDFIDRFDTWVEADYNNRIHLGNSMDCLTPCQAFDQFIEFKRVAKRADLELFISKTSRPLKCGRNGVTWGGKVYGRGDAALFPYFGKEIYLRVDPSDVTRATAWTMGDALIAELSESQNMPWNATDAEFEAAARERKQIRTLTNSYRQLGPKHNADIGELMHIRREEAQQAASTDPDRRPPTLVPVRTPLEVGTMALRTAVGAESMSAPPRQGGQRKVKMFDLVAAADDLPTPPPRRQSSLLYGGTEVTHEEL